MLTTDESIDLMSGEDLAWMLNNIYGSIVVGVGAGLTGKTGRTTVEAWADFAQPDVQPAEENITRMRAMLRVWFLLAPVVGRSTAVWWFAGMIEGSYVGVKDDEDRQSPNMLSHAGKLDELMSRAETFRYYVDNDVWM